MSCERYGRANSSLTAWAAAGLACILGFSRLSYGLLLPALRHDLHGSYGAFGLVGSANFTGYLIGTLGLPPLLLRFRNQIRVNTLAMAAMNICMILSALSVNLVQLAVWRFLIGVFSAFATVLTITILLNHVKPSERGRASGLLWMGGAAGVVASGLVAPWAVEATASPLWRVTWISMGCVGAFITYGLNRVCRSATTETPETGRASSTSVQAAPSASMRSDLGDIVRPSRLLFLALTYGAFGAGYIVYFTFLIALLIHQGVPALLTGIVWAAVGLAGIMGAIVSGRAVDEWPSGLMLALTLALGGLGAAAILVDNRAIEVVGAGLVGMSAFGTPTIVTALLKRHVSPARYADSLSWITAAFALGQILGPAAAGQVIDRAGLVVGTAGAGLLLILAGIFATTYWSVRSF